MRTITYASPINQNIFSFNFSIFCCAISHAAGSPEMVTFRMQMRHERLCRGADGRCTPFPVPWFVWFIETFPETIHGSSFLRSN